MGYDICHHLWFPDNRLIILLKYKYDGKQKYDWEVDSCNTKKGEDLGSGRALTKFRCMIS